MVMSEFPYVKAVLGDCGRVSVPDYVQKVVWVMGEAFQRILQAAAGRTIRSFQAKMYVLSQKHHPCTGKLNSEMPGDSKITSVQCGEF